MEKKKFFLIKIFLKDSRTLYARAHGFTGPNFIILFRSGAIQPYNNIIVARFVVVVGFFRFSIDDTTTTSTRVTRKARTDFRLIFEVNFRIGAAKAVRSGQRK